MKEVRKQLKPGTLSFDNRLAAALNKRDKYPELHARPVNYVEDGSGRDGYIIVNQGGMKNAGRKKHF